MPLTRSHCRRWLRSCGAAFGPAVDKVQQPARDQVILLLRGNRRLLLNAGANAPRLQLTELLRDNPAEPPMFCMLLRKHLVGARVAEITQPLMERLVRMELDITDEFGRPGRRTLVLEAMGLRSNLILLDGDGRIIECLRRVDADLSAARQVLPGLFYQAPASRGPAAGDAGNRGGIPGPSGRGQSRAAAGRVFAGSVFRPFSSDCPGAGLPHHRGDRQPPVWPGAGWGGSILAGSVCSHRGSKGKPLCAILPVEGRPSGGVFGLWPSGSMAPEWSVCAVRASLRCWTGSMRFGSGRSGYGRRARI